MSMVQSAPTLAFPKPGPLLKWVMLALFGIWLFFALGLNWGGLPPASFLLLVGQTDAIMSGEVWRLLTAPLLHMPQGGLSHILFALVGLYFLGAPLEKSWGVKKFARFLIVSAVGSYALQALLLWALPSTLGPKLAPLHYFGVMPVVNAIAVAWALSFKGQKVMLFLALPVSSHLLLGFVVAMSVLSLIAGSMPASGHIAQFAGLLLGYLLAGGNALFLRRWWIQLRLAQLQAGSRKELRKRKDRRKSSGLSVIDGGRSSGQSRSENGRTLH